MSVAEDVAQLRARVALYVAAEAAVLTGQEYQIGQGGTARRLRRADLSEIRDEIRRLNDQIHALDPASRAPRAGVFQIRG